MSDAGQEAARATTGATVLRGGLWNTASQALPQVYTLVLSVVAARVLGPDDMGLQSFISFVSTAAVVILTGGLPIALMRYVGELEGRGHPDAVRSLLRLSWAIEIVAAALGFTLLAVWGQGEGDLRSAWLLAGLGTALAILHRVPSSVLIGLQLWREASLVGVVTGFVGTAATIVVLLAGGGITGMFVVAAVQAGVNLVWTGVWARRARLARARRDFVPAPAAVIATARRGLLSFTAFATLDALLSFIVWRRTEFFFLERTATPAELAVYSIAYATASALVLVPAALGSVLAPAVATLFGAGQRDRIRSGFSRSLRLLLLFTLPITAGVLAIGPALLVAVYGEEYADTGLVLRLMMLSFPLVPLVTVGQALLDGLGKIVVQLVISAVAAAVNLALDVALIAPYGAPGAAVANAGAQIVFAVPLMVYVVRYVGGVDWRGAYLARASVVSVVCGVASWVVLQGAQAVLPLFAAELVAIAGGVLVFTVGMSLTRSVAPEDATWMLEVVGNRFGHAPARLMRLVLGRSVGTPSGQTGHDLEVPDA